MKGFHISIQVASRMAKRMSKGNRKHVLPLLGSCHGSRPCVKCEVCVFLCKILPTAVRNIVPVCKPRRLCVTNLFSLMDFDI